MTYDQARFHLQNRVREYQSNAERLRRSATIEKNVAAGTADLHLRRQGYETAAKWEAQAVAIEQDAEAITAVLDRNDWLFGCLESARRGHDG